MVPPALLSREAYPFTLEIINGKKMNELGNQLWMALQDYHANKNFLVSCLYAVLLLPRDARTNYEAYLTNI